MQRAKPVVRMDSPFQVNGVQDRPNVLVRLAIARETLRCAYYCIVRPDRVGWGPSKPSYQFPEVPTPRVFEVGDRVERLGEAWKGFVGTVTAVDTSVYLVTVRYDEVGQHISYQGWTPVEHSNQIKLIES